MPARQAATGAAGVAHDADGGIPSTIPRDARPGASRGPGRASREAADPPGREFCRDLPCVGSLVPQPPTTPWYARVLQPGRQPLAAPLREADVTPSLSGYPPGFWVSSWTNCMPHRHLTR